jgi:hypothetical protein
MTDIAPAAPIKIRRFSLPRLGFPRLRLGASFTGIGGLVANAFTLAYVAPYTSLHRRPPIIVDDDLEGRDPRW